MKTEEPRLTISFAYNHTSGTFIAYLENGASFTVTRDHIGGKLENALQLFKGGVIASQGGRFRQAPKTSRELAYEYNQGDVRRFSENGLPELNLEDLELDFDE